MIRIYHGRRSGERTALHHSRDGALLSGGRSGRGTRIADVLRMLLDNSTSEIEVRADPSRMRAGDLARQVGSFERARVDVGWASAIPLEASLAALLDEWRARRAVAASGGSGA